MVNQLLPVLCKGILPCMILSVSFWNSNYCLKGYKSHCVFLPPSFPCKLVQQPTKLLKRKEFPWKFQVFCCSSSNRHFESETEVVTKSPAHRFFSPRDAVKAHWWAWFKMFFRYKWFFTEYYTNEMHQVTVLISKSSLASTPVSWPMRYWRSAMVILFFKTEQHLSHSSYPSYVPVSLLCHEIKSQSVSGGAAAALERMMPLIQTGPLASVRQ